MHPFTASHPNASLALVLSGGNALGAYHAGAYQALHEAGWLPDRVVGASAGAVSGAVICGNAPEDRISRLESLWSPSAEPASNAKPGAIEEMRRTQAVVFSLLMGRPGLFAPRSIYGPWWNPFGNPEPASLYDATPMDRSLEQLVDFERLNADSPRFGITAVDVESGEDILFETGTHALGPDHIRASSALLPAFSPVEIDGRLLADAGLSLNLPLDAVLNEASERPLLCIAVDLLPLHGPRPGTLGETIIRMQDLMFAAQSRRAIAAWQAIFDARAAAGACRSVTLVHVAYSDQQREVSGKAFDFSPRSARMRWQSGHADLSAALNALHEDASGGAEPGLRVVGGVLRDGEVRYERIKHESRPQPG
jgi:NTE family protein